MKLLNNGIVFKTIVNLGQIKAARSLITALSERASKLTAGNGVSLCQ